MSNWTLLSNHGHVLVCLSRDPEARLRDVAADVGITERAVQKIVRDLQDGGMISVTKTGRRNCYRIHKKTCLRHPLEADCTLRDLIGVVNRQPAKVTDTQSSARTETKTDSRSKKVGSVPDMANEHDSKQQSGIPKPVKAKKTGEKSSKPSDGIEKQQGSLF